VGKLGKHDLLEALYVHPISTDSMTAREIDMGQDRRGSVDVAGRVELGH
jgi:hypothetical protein